MQKRRKVKCKRAAGKRFFLVAAKRRIQMCVSGPTIVAQLRQIIKINELGAITITYHWNDQRSLRVFCCFYSAIFQLAGAKFETFAYNSRTVWSSCQRFEINKLDVCNKFRGNGSRDFCFRTRKPPRKFGVKSDLIRKRLKYGKKYFTRLYVLKYPFIPINPLLAVMRFISFFTFFLSFFFLPKFCSLFF